MKGSIQERQYESGKTVYRLQIDLPDNGNEGRERISETFETREEAEYRRWEFNRKQDPEECVESGEITVKRLLLNWLKHKKGSVNPRTYEGYERDTENHLIPDLGHRKLENLHFSHIEDYYDDKQNGGLGDGEEGLKGSTVHQHHVVLNQAFNWAIKQGFTDKNPVQLVDPPKQNSGEMNILKPRETARLLELIKEKDWHPEIFLTAVYTGLRRAEILGLQWKDIDMDQGTAAIQNTLCRSPEDDYNQLLLQETTKTDGGRRSIPLYDDLVDILKDHKERQNAWKSDLDGIWGTQEKVVNRQTEYLDFVFTNKIGDPIHPDKVTDHFRRLVKKMDLRKKIRFHDLRHTAVSGMIREGIDITTVSRCVGHSEVQTTLNTYSHLMPGMKEKAFNAYGDMLNESG